MPSACSGDLLATDVEVPHYPHYLVLTPLASETKSQQYTLVLFAFGKLNAFLHVAA